MKKKARVILVILVLSIAYAFRVYYINKYSPDLRKYTQEQVGKEFKAFGGNILVNKIELVDKKDLKSINRLSYNNRKYLDGKVNKCVKVIYEINKINNSENLDIRVNTDGYIYYDGLPSAENIGNNKFEYIIPLPDDKKINIEDIRVFFENIKSNELEHHYIKGVN